MNGLIASLEAKYSKSTANQGKGKREPSVAPEEPSEEQFAAARSEIHKCALHVPNALLSTEAHRRTLLCLAAFFFCFVLVAACCLLQPSSHFLYFCCMTYTRDDSARTNDAC